MSFNGIIDLRKARLWVYLAAMTKRFTHVNVGTCSASVSFTLEDGIIRDVSFDGGCSGNLQGISHLVEGMDAREAQKKLEGIRCGFKPTSCPDQFAAGLKEALASLDAEKQPVSD